MNNIKTEKLISIALRMYDAMHSSNKERCSYKRFFGKINLQIKNDTKDNVNINALNNNIKYISHHHICFCASHYAIKYHFFEGYAFDTSLKLGCKTWNEMNDSSYFILDLHDTLYVSVNKDTDKKENLISTICREQHLLVDKDILKEQTKIIIKKNKEYIKRKTYWECFKEAMICIPKNNETITRGIIYTYLQKWNDKNNVKLFIPS
jgi:hypothetical protein|uniref:Uncharacterized protein n=1 Tax=viral metagenome TaxID=1070528 RepID=A0A6C0BRX4_9ZZZZ